jgi:polyhydroxyalkanoate synthesis repressor PhaR
MIEAKGLDGILRGRSAMPEESGSETKPVTIKKYANRRLYNTATSSYVTLDHLAQMVKEGVEFVVYDAKTGDDITRSVLTQIIVEEEAKGQNLLPISFLRHLISFYGDSLQALVPRYLDHTMQTFARNQEQMRRYIQETMGGLFPFGRLEEMGKQNMAILESAMNMFSPFHQKGENQPEPAEERNTDQPDEESEDARIEELRARLNEMQAQLNSLTGGNRKTN